MMECRVEAIIQKCNCIPFYYPQLGTNYYLVNSNVCCDSFYLINNLEIPAYARFSQCSLVDSECLYKYQSKFTLIIP